MKRHPIAVVLGVVGVVAGLAVLLQLRQVDRAAPGATQASAEPAAGGAQPECVPATTGTARALEEAAPDRGLGEVALPHKDPRELLPSGRFPWEWQDLVAQINKREGEVKPYVESMRAQFDGIETMKIVAHTTQLADLDGIPKGTELTSTFLISLRPFRVHEVTEAQGYSRTKITTPNGQYVSTTSAQGNTTNVRKNLEPAPLLHENLPFIEPVFGWWDQYGKGMDEDAGGVKTVELTRNEADGSQRPFSASCIPVKSVVGKLNLAQEPGQASAPLYMAECVYWPALLPEFRTEVAHDWVTYPHHNGLVLPKVTEKRVGRHFETLASRTVYESVEFNVPIEEAAYDFPNR